MNESDISIQKIADEVSKLPEKEWQTSLANLTQNDAKLIQDVTVLLEQKKHTQFNTNSSSIADTNSEPNSNQQAVASIDLKPGDRIGPYLILEEIGSGGMGVVFLVEQKKPVHRRLALKVIKLGMDTNDVLARFELERQALALMSHPNVAAVIDVGMTDSGRPYFLMEYVHGINIVKYANENNLTIHARIKLLMQACKGVLHAHQKGIVHRDLKPENILVTEHEGVALVKIIDFGVAKSIQQNISDGEIYTRVGAFIGTPNYISPEQAGASSQDIDVLTDLYSLGIILYELLVGELPYNNDTFNNKSIADIQRIIQYQKTPSPYERLSALNCDSKFISLKRKSSFSDIKRNLKGDLSCIIMHAIEKNKNERYSSVFAFDADLKCYLEGLPVEAQPHSAMYIMRRFISRNKIMVGSVASIILALTVGLGTALTSLKHAERESAHAAAVSALIGDILLNADPWNLKYRHEITLNQVIIELEKKINNNQLLQGKEFDKARELGMESSLLWTLREHIGDLHLSVGNNQAAESNYLQAISLHEANNTNDEYKIIDLKIKRSNTLIILGKLDLAEDLFNQAIVKLDPPNNKQEALLMLSAIGVFKSKGEIKKSIEYNTKLATIAEEIFGEKSNENIAQLLRLASSLHYTYESDNMIQALELSKKARKIAHDLLPSNIQLEAKATSAIINLLSSLNHISEATAEAQSFVDWCQQEFGEEHIQTSQAQVTLARAYTWVGNTNGILEITDHIQPILDKTVKKDHYLMQDVRELRSNALILLYRFDEAVPLLEKGLSVAESQNNIPDVVHYSSLISIASYYLGDIKKARNSMQNVIANEPTKEGWNISVYHSELAQIYLANDEVEDATIEASKALEMDKTNFTVYTIMGLISQRQQNYDLALTYLQQAENGWVAIGGNINDSNHNELVSDRVLMLLHADKRKKALDLAKSIKIEETTSVNAAAVQLKIMAAKVANGIEVDQDEANNLLDKINKHWAVITLQNKSAKRAFDRIKNINPE